jgi:hypothetical protein
MSPANGQNMSSNGAYQLERFPRKMEATTFDTLPDLVLLELFSYFSCLELLHSFSSVNIRINTVLFEPGVIRHVDWHQLSAYHRNIIENRLVSVASITTDSLIFAERFLKLRNLRRLCLVNTAPGDLMKFVWTDWRFALDGVNEIRFITTNSAEDTFIDVEILPVLVFYLIGYVPTLHTLHLPSSYIITSFMCPPITIANLHTCKYRLEIYLFQK